MGIEDALRLEVASTPKWRTVEGVVFALERTLAPHGATVTANALVPYRDGCVKTRQVDVHVSIPSPPRTLTIGIEVKDERRPMSVDEVEAIAAKLGKLELDRRCLIAVAGFTETAVRDAKVAGLELLKIDEIEGVDWCGGEPTTIRVRRAEVVGVCCDYYADTFASIAREVSGWQLGDVMLIDHRGEASLLVFADVHGNRTLEQPQTFAAREGARISITVNNPTGEWLGLRCGERVVPAPEAIHVEVKVREAVSEAPMLAYRLHNHQALTGLVDVDGKPMQVTVVGATGAEPATLKLTVAAAAPRRVQV